MAECPTCKLEMESHSSAELAECCMKQVSDEPYEKGVCPNCLHDINGHTDDQLGKCTVAFLNSSLS